ncbi:MAG: methyltransferase domain-containing protein [Deltaproteobacteria bacterium]|nr:methyltransferase domain-containing protein [Deltaproteobacteria bacterium]
MLGFLKRFTTALAGQAKKAKESLETKSGLQPILSLESRLPLPKIKQLLDLVGERFVIASLPLLSGKTVLEVGENPLQFQKAIVEKKPNFFCGVLLDFSPADGKKLPPTRMILKGSLKALPFEKEFFDCIVARINTSHQGDVVSAIKELGRVLAPGASALILDFHPFGLYAKSGTDRLRSVQASIRGLEDYYKMCKLSGLNIVDVKEGFVDDTLRSQFKTPDELNTFREIKGSPLVLFLLVKKG